MKLILFALISWYFNGITCQTQPTIILTLHGRGESADAGNAHSFVTRFSDVLRNRSINKYEVINIGLSDNSDEDYDWSSYRSMDFQAEKLCQQLSKEEIWNKLLETDHIILVGFSQGGLLWRGLLWGQCLDPLVPRIDKLISFGGPHSGVFGKPDCSQMDTKYEILIKVCQWIQKFDDITGKGPSLYDIFMYTELAQTAFSASSYWNDPINPKQRQTWLAQINNENDTTADKYLRNKLNNGLVLISFGDDETVLPQISSAFGYWDSMGKNLIPFNETELYQNDWIGLKALDQSNMIKLYTIENEGHMDIPDDFIRDKFLQFLN